MEFDQAFEILLHHEGAYVHHSADPGGQTRWGITETVARENGYTGEMQYFPIEMAKEIYRRNYWDAVKADELPQALRYPMFDSAVNSGVAQAVLWLQRALGIDADGVFGKKTQEAVNSCDAEAAARSLLGWRLQYLTKLPNWPVFGRGWARRLAEILRSIS